MKHYALDSNTVSYILKKNTRVTNRLREMGAGWDNGQSVICVNLRNLRTNCKSWYRWSADYADYADYGCA
jgi:hypothetical protein